ncbi:uncharacterized protein RSE6_12887 [Rhynchosporium secalis]|uniref:Uncharacterized protein n=1 Tax=Rhynchosporium secalis TaxID=38038 RepID=A0A1E1MRK1_RHYSE|nr:uncharacterized protein RSE6_12887 [Rhynchosporium secalis]
MDPKQRSRRLDQIAKEAGVILEIDLTTLTPQKTLTFKVSDDEGKADEILGQLKIEDSVGRPQSKGLRRFSGRISKSLYTYDELYSALSRVVSDNGSAGVVEVLLGRFNAVEGNINLSRRASISVIKRIRNTDSAEQRGRLIHTATELGRSDLVQLLAPHADQSSLDQALQIAIEKRDLESVETLLRYGANSALYDETFISAAQDGDAELLSLLLRASMRVSEDCMTWSLLSATTCGSLDAVLLLTRAGANADYDNAAALMCAVEMNRLDLAVAIITSPNAPSGENLDSILGNMFTTITSPATKILLVEVLLCGGPTGNATSEALFKATLLANVEMIQLLLAYQADVNLEGASALAHAIQRNRGDLVSVLLQSQTLKPEYASELVQHIPRGCESTDRIAILSVLLEHGASGTYCNELLIVVAEHNDLDTAELLVSYGRDQSESVCSVNYNAARCLQIAISNNHLEMVKVLALKGKPTRFSLAKSFSYIPPNICKDDYFMLVQTLLRGGAQGVEVNEALHDAVTGNHKSSRMVELLVQFGAEVSDETLFACVSNGAIDILAFLTKGNIKSTSCAEAITIAIKAHSNGIRFQLVRLLLSPATSAGPDVPQIASAVITVLQNTPEDIKLLDLLCREGKANINHDHGLAVVLAAKHMNPMTLEIILQDEGCLPNLQTIERGLRCALDLPLTDVDRRNKIDILLRRGKPQDAMDQALINEIESSLATKDFSVIESLLTAGADINAYGGRALCLATSRKSIADLIVASRPNQQTLSAGLASAMSLQEPARHAMCEQLLAAGASGEEIHRSLCIAAMEGPTALPLIRLLLPHADVNFNDGEVFRVVIREVFSEALDLLLSLHPIMPSPMTKAIAFHEAMEIKDREGRLKLVGRLLKSRIPEPVIADGLIVAVSFGEIELVNVLLQAGASVDFKLGAAIHSAVSSGNNVILKLLAAKKPTLATLSSAFEGASAIKSQPEVYFLILETLLGAGLRGPSIDAALLDAVRGGDQEMKISELLFREGASLEWRDGEALAIATQLGSMNMVQLLLERPAPQHVLARSWDIATQLPKDHRYRVVELLLQAGKAVDQHVSNALTAATKETPSDRNLIKILLNAGVFDQGESMVYAAMSRDLRTLTLLSNSPKATETISSTFHKATSTGILWQSATGLAIVELMLKKGACGDSVGEALCQAMERLETGSDVLAADFVEVFLRYGADFNYKRGLVLQRAARQINNDVIEKLLPFANVESKAMSMPYLFGSGNDKTSVQQALEAFKESLSGEEQDAIVMFKHPDLELQPVLFQALEKYPRDTTILRTLLDIGYSPNQWQMGGDELNPEHWPILCWALNQPEKKISTAVIEILIDEGASINHRFKTGVTPLTLAIQNQRADVVLKLLNKGANVTQPDAEGITPLNLAGSFTNTDIMGYILQAGAETDDGSLHDVSRQLRCDAMRTLIKNGHEVDFPSDRHEGRSALAELCLRAMDDSPSPAKLEGAIQCLIVNDANIREASYSGKTIFHYALDSSDPSTILAVLLKLMWKFINEDAFLFTDNKYTYSLTKYVEKGLFAGPQKQKEELLQLLRNKRAKDRFWANSIDGVQPEDYCNGPPHIEAEVRLQKTRLKRLAEQKEDTQRAIELKRAAVAGEVEIMHLITEAELARERQKGQVERELLTEKAATALQLEKSADAQRDTMLTQKHTREEGHQRQLRDILIATQQAITAEEFEKERTSSMMQIEFLERRTQIEEASIRERVDIENNGIRMRLAIEGGGYEEQEKFHAKQYEREMARIKMQKQLVAGQTTLAGTLQGGRLNQRQIGFITEP